MLNFLVSGVQYLDMKENVYQMLDECLINLNLEEGNMAVYLTIYQKGEKL
jgi:hypothetical protein